MTEVLTAPAVNGKRTRHLRRVGRGAFVAALATGVVMSGTPAMASSAKDWTIVAHRGGLSNGVQHSLELLTRMLDVKADAVELDIQVTRDRVPVLLHGDNELGLLTTNCSGNVSDHLYREIKKCELVNRTGDRAFDDQNILTMSSVLRMLQDETSSSFRVFLHVKGNSKASAKKIAKVVKREGMQRQTIVIASSETMLKHLKTYKLRKQGLVFNSPSGWNKDYKFLIPYNVTVNEDLVERADDNNQKVFPVESHPHSLLDLNAVDGLHGVLANNLIGALVLAGRLDDLVSINEEKREKSTPAEGPSRTTGPMDF